MNLKALRLVQALLVGLVVLFIGALFCEVLTSPMQGPRINVKKLPPEAQAVANEQPSVPTTPEQWKRLDKVMAQHGGWPSGGDVFLGFVRASWYWFLLLPTVGVGALFLRWKAVTLPEVIAVSGPSLLLLLYAFSVASPFKT